jgi:opine dehydrogenase
VLATSWRTSRGLPPGPDHPERRLDRETKGDFEYYLQGITPSIALVLERIDAERLAVARSLGLRNCPPWSGCTCPIRRRGNGLYEAIRNTSAYQGIKAPPSIDHRYVFEDVPMSLVPIASLGRALGVATPTIDMIIDLACLMHRVDYRAFGRTVERLGLAGLSVKQILEVVV